MGTTEIIQETLTDPVDADLQETCAQGLPSACLPLPPVLKLTAVFTLGCRVTRTNLKRTKCKAKHLGPKPKCVTQRSGHAPSEKRV